MSTSTSDQLIFVSSNPRKAEEAERILGFPLLRVALLLPEIQSQGVEEITRHKLEVARTKGYRRLLVEDVSLGFEELGNFPGPYVKWLLESAGGKGLGAIAYALRNRRALAQCCAGYWDGQEAFIFLGQVHGEILVEPRGDRSFGWDAWFVPEGSKKTFSEMSAEEKDAVSHRGAAYRVLKEHLATEKSAKPEKTK